MNNENYYVYKISIPKWKRTYMLYKFWRENNVTPEFNEPYLLNNVDFKNLMVKYNIPKYWYAKVTL